MYSSTTTPDITLFLRMQRITAVNPETASGSLADLFTTVHGKLGMVPNMMRTMGASPAVLGAYLSFTGALGEGSLSAKLGELIALTVAEANSCDYCLAAHTTITTQLMKVPADTALAARAGVGVDTKADAALAFARALVESRGQVSDADVQAVRAAGYSEGEVGEIIAYTAINIFTNYFNTAAKTVVDFPAAEKLTLATA